MSDNAPRQQPDLGHTPPHPSVVQIKWALIGALCCLPIAVGFWYNGAPADGSAWVSPVSSAPSYHMYRGGYFNSAAYNCRSAFRYQSEADTLYFYVGFRLARTP